MNDLDIVSTCSIKHHSLQEFENLILKYDVDAACSGEAYKSLPFLEELAFRENPLVKRICTFEIDIDIENKKMHIYGQIQEVLKCLQDETLFKYLKVVFYGHANLILVDPIVKTFERFEPHGEFVNDPQHHQNQKVDEIVNDLLENKFGKIYLPGYIYIPPSDYCPKIGPQFYEEYTMTEACKNRLIKGYCVLYSIMYAQWRMWFPYLPRSVLIEELVRFSNIPLFFARYITYINSTLAEKEKREGQLIVYTIFLVGGVRYRGNLINDKMEGWGILIGKNGDIIYEGDFKNDQLNGWGTHYFKQRGTYVGEFKDNLRHGLGTHFYKDGSKYTGEWQNDRRHGKGTYFYKDSSKYIGEWKDDKRWQGREFLQVPQIYDPTMISSSYSYSSSAKRQKLTKE
jgi:hypothetical protein